MVSHVLILEFLANKNEILIHNLSWLKIQCYNVEQTIIYSIPMIYYFTRYNPLYCCKTNRKSYAFDGETSERDLMSLLKSSTDHFYVFIALSLFLFQAYFELKGITVAWILSSITPLKILNFQQIKDILIFHENRENREWLFLQSKGNNYSIVSCWYILHCIGISVQVWSQYKNMFSK